MNLVTIDELSYSPTDALGDWCAAAIIDAETFEAKMQ